MPKQRENWVDIVKLFACFLVVSGHFFQSMTAGEIIEETILTRWFDQTIYYFHVPLFFICSGYLFQKYTKVESFGQWKNNAFKKFVSLGVPYFFFSSVTWLLKVLFSGAVNNKADGFLTSIFISPISPYWYLYALFFLFVITPTITNTKMNIVVLAVAVVMKLLSFLPIEVNIYALSTVLDNEIWFVIGMTFCSFRLTDKIDYKKTNFVIGLLGLAFISFSFVLCCFSIHNAAISFIMGILGCTVTVLIALEIQNKNITVRINDRLAKYTLPVFLMHTIFAAALRSILLKIGITSDIIHILSGLLISFSGPMIAFYVMNKIKYVDFIISPYKYINRNKGMKECLKN